MIKLGLFPSIRRATRKLGVNAFVACICRSTCAFSAWAISASSTIILLRDPCHCAQACASIRIDKLQKALRLHHQNPFPNTAPEAKSTRTILLILTPLPVAGNLTPYDKKLNVVVIAEQMKHFAYEEARLLRLTEIWVREKGPNARDGEEWTDERKSAWKTNKASFGILEGQTVFEVTVTKRMVNSPGLLAGPCATLFIDVGSISALDALATVTGDPILGYSNSMNVVWHAAATVGQTLRVVSTTLSVGKRVESAISDIYNKETGQLLVSGTHIVSPIASLSEGALPFFHHRAQAKL
ncbi:hypothetical protein NM688_g3922 [Phlebia brevispora]|uniref:Uncharacterized protein n=1 Tax=Phlebia brevispora TaxID=194682 RepID=A0ACC1T4B7_9APHY|nr:hypothetical protein NM688_g3922 [Phlebia brevispora]